MGSDQKQESGAFGHEPQQHAPGPWWVDEDSWLYTKLLYVRVDDERPHTIAEVDPDGYIEDEADDAGAALATAKLIAAAPALADALGTILECFRPVVPIDVAAHSKATAALRAAGRLP